MYLNRVIKIYLSRCALKKGILQRPIACLLGVSSLAMFSCAALAQEKAVSEKKAAPLRSPFMEDEDLIAQEKAKEEARLKAAEEKEEARLKAEKEKADALELREENRKVALRAALAPIKVLARGLQGDRAVVLLAVDTNRRIMLAKDETMVLTTPAGAIELRLIKVTRQTLNFELEDGTLIPLQ